MSLDQLSQNDKAKLNAFVEQGMKTLQSIDDLKAGLKDVVTNLATDFDVKPAVLNKALRAAFKANLHEDRDTLDQVQMILEAVGRG